MTTLDREHLQALHARVRDEVDAEERRVRMVGGEDVGFGAAGAISGFLLRSRVVSGWPALHVRAYNADVLPDDAHIPEDDPRRMRLLRLERLAPAVLLCLLDGIPQVVRIEEPRQGIQFGVDLAPGAEGTTGATIGLRDVVDREDRHRQGGAVPPRRARRIDVARLAERIAAESGTRVNDFEGPGTQPAEFAMEMLQFPFRAVFGDPTKGGPHGGGGPAVDFSALFRPAIGSRTCASGRRPCREPRDRSGPDPRGHGQPRWAALARADLSLQAIGTWTRSCHATRACSCPPTCRRSWCPPPAR